jgi:hypothetical protein
MLTAILNEIDQLKIELNRLRPLMVNRFATRLILNTPTKAIELRAIL